MAFNYMTAAPVVTAPIAQALLSQWQRPGRTFQAKGANDLRFQGVLVKLNTPSTRPPQGARGRQTVIPAALARQTLHQLRNRPVNVSNDLADHEKQQTVGTLTGAWIEGDNLMVEGELWDKNYPDLVAMIQRNIGQLGMSYELGDAEVEDEGQPVWTLRGLRWQGCSILKRAAAAYPDTKISIAAAACW